MGSVRQAKHAVYSPKYHLLDPAKYRKLVLEGLVAERLKEIFYGIAERYELEIDTLEVMPDHVHLFVLVPPKYSPSRVVQIVKSVSTREVYRRHTELREALWSEEPLSDVYFVRMVGDEMTVAMIRRYNKLQHEDQLRLDL